MEEWDKFESLGAGCTSGRGQDFTGSFVHSPGVPQDWLWWEGGWRTRMVLRRSGCRTLANQKGAAVDVAFLFGVAAVDQADADCAPVNAASKFAVSVYSWNLTIFPFRIVKAIAQSA